MIIAGAGGHAKELITIIEEDDFDMANVYFFDDTPTAPGKIFNKYTVLKTMNDVITLFGKDNRFVLGTGSPLSRKTLYNKLTSAGGKCVSIISKYASIGKHDVHLGEGLNIFQNSILTNEITIGLGSLIHLNVTIHHNCHVGEFCELSPGCMILGNVTVGNNCSVGAGATILPKIIVGDNVIIGAGAVVTKNIESNKTVKGVPAK